MASVLLIAGLVALGVGLAVGITNALLIEGAKVSPVIATIATLGGATGMALMLRPTAAGLISDELSTVFKDGPWFLPWPLIVLAVLGIVADVGLWRSGTGLNLRAVGLQPGQSPALGHAGTTIRILAYLACGVLSGFAGIANCGPGAHRRCHGGGQLHAPCDRRTRARWCEPARRAGQLPRLSRRCRGPGPGPDAAADPRHLRRDGLPVHGLSDARGAARLLDRSATEAPADAGRGGGGRWDVTCHRALRPRRDDRMRLSAFMFLTDQTIGPAELAIALEERGFHGLWVPEHPHIPTRRATPVPPAYGGGDLATFYLRLLDPFVALTAAAAVTSTLRVGTGICLLALRDAVVTAKEVATLDHLSGGRFDFGVGYGWNADEFDDHGQRFGDRHTVVPREARTDAWPVGGEVASYRGLHVAMEPSWAWPKPIRGAAIPVWLGGNGPTTMRGRPPGRTGGIRPRRRRSLGEDIARFRAFVDDSGRDPATGPRRRGCRTGRPRPHACVRRLGVEELSVALPSAGATRCSPSSTTSSSCGDRVRLRPRSRLREEPV